MDEIDETQEVEQWMEGNTEGSLTTEELLELVVRGHGVCEHYCCSRANYGQEKCTCVRSMFPTPKHYELYKQARAYYIKNIAIQKVAELIGKAHAPACE